MIHAFENIEEVIITQSVDTIIVVFPYRERHNMKLCGKWDIMVTNRCDDMGVVIMGITEPGERFMISAKKVVLKQKEE